MRKKTFSYPKLLPLAIPAGWLVSFSNHFVDEDPIDNGKGEVANMYGFSYNVLYLDCFQIDENGYYEPDRRSGKYSLELEWYPEFDVNGYYILTLFRNEQERDLQKILHHESKDRYKIQSLINFILFSIDSDFNFCEKKYYSLVENKMYFQSKVALIEPYSHWVVLENSVFFSKNQNDLILWLSQKRVINSNVKNFYDIKIFKKNNIFFTSFYSNDLLETSHVSVDIEKALKVANYCLACASLFRISDLEYFINSIK